MSLFYKRRYFLRKNCAINASMVGPGFEAKILIAEISIGGLRVNWLEEPPENFPIGCRVRITLPALNAELPIITGSQMIWKTQSQTGLTIVYSNCSDFAFQQLIDRIGETVFASS